MILDMHEPAGPAAAEPAAADELIQLADEMSVAGDAFDLSRPEVEDLCLAGIDASFADREPQRTVGAEFVPAIERVR